ncbi:hypothetical protein PHYSODRAFT_532084 [Phytophthora sojae]|uniref:PX domain-containing protein n=1 Tax=Phytophthora sojae (strain P6497) TaxID=1094619 RepID=G5AD26_PHYSP|nr:hypothetical protein PHYSODRAFT_532084 [Phytophthora sojae]EGZ06080.1 hypothetical protein PHYSODRAFT_532084 [Phytophthora sojae]|eukprot:XP_009537977.1 hypothetical protein PHYSODRAFT_532084 [Phytophthora sojae]
MLQYKLPSTSSQQHKPTPLAKQVAAPRPDWDPITSLSKIDHAEINHTRVRGGVVFYKVEVYLKHQVNRIPTNVKSESDPNRKPDYVVKRRFSDFDLLRRHVGQHARREIVGACPYCDRFRLFMLHCYNQPKAFVKLCAGVETRKKLLARFLNRIIELTVADERGGARIPRVRQCPGVRAIPILVDQFMRRRYVV